MSSPSKSTKKKINILGTEIQPGKNYELNLSVAKLHTSTPIQIPIYVNRAKKDGKTIVLMAGVHGDEINGIEIIRRIIIEKINKPLQGTIICLPIFNIFGFLNLERELPDGRDLNRSFPGSKNGSLASQFAYQFMHEIAPVADLVLDFHTGSSQRNNYPQVRCDFNDNASLELAKEFLSPIILNSQLIHKTIREALSKKGKRYLIYEGGKSNFIDEDVVSQGILGIKRILAHFKMYREVEKIESQNTTIILRDSKWMRAPISGLFLAKVQNGSRVAKGDVIGLIMDPFGKTERKIKAQRKSVVLCVNEAPTIYKGDAIFHIGFDELD